MTNLNLNIFEQEALRYLLNKLILLKVDELGYFIVKIQNDIYMVLTPSDFNVYRKILDKLPIK